MSLGSGGRNRISPDLRDAHELVFCGEDLNLKGDAAKFAELDLCWTHMVRALRNGESWAKAWIETAAQAERDADAAERDKVEPDYERLVEIEEAFRAGTAPTPA